MIGINKIYSVDCLMGMREIPDESIDMIFTDLPYGITEGNNWDRVIPYKPLWEQFERIIKANGAILLFGQGKFTARTILSNEKIHRYNIVWKKTTPTGFLNANRMPMRIHEDIMVFYKSPPTYNPQKTTGHKRKISKAEHKKNCELRRATADMGLHHTTAPNVIPQAYGSFPLTSKKKPYIRHRSLLSFADMQYEHIQTPVIRCLIAAAALAQFRWRQ